MQRTRRSLRPRLSAGSGAASLRALLLAALVLAGMTAGLGPVPAALGGSLLVFAVTLGSLAAGSLAAFTLLYITAGLSGSPVPALLAVSGGLVYLLEGAPGERGDQARLVGKALAFWAPAALLVYAWTISPGLEEARALGALLGAERVLLAAAALYAAVIAYSVLHPRPGLPELVGAWRRLSRGRLFPIRAAYYGLGLYASTLDPAILVALAAGAGACLSVRVLTGRDSLGLVASVLVFVGMLHLFGVADNFDAYLAPTP